MIFQYLCIIIILFWASLAWSGDKVAGEISTYESPHGITERCVALTKIPGGAYTADQISEEKALCDLDFYDKNVAMCPKLRSTSPGSFVYRLEGSSHAGKQELFEKNVCPRGAILVSEASGPPTSYKVTMNSPNTSGTFSTSSLLYYHFSRYLDSSIRVPVSVWRSMDRKTHEQRVTRQGLKHSAGKSSLKMNHAAWQVLDKAENNPSQYPDTDELFTSDRMQIYGVMLNIKGKRYGPELNGTRQSGWGDGQSRDFQETAPFRALRADKPLDEAIEEGISRASADPVLKKAMRGGVSQQQIAYWMQDLIEITLLDYIFSQQDRIGNIDYVEYWHWIEDGRVKVTENKPATETDHAVLKIRRTWLNDNDAGGKVRYANFTKRTDMLEKIRHYNPKTYKRLMALDRELQNQGGLYQYVRETFGLSNAQFKQIVDNVHMAADIFRSTCQSGKLRLDLDPDSFFLTGRGIEEKTSCGD